MSIPDAPWVGKCKEDYYGYDDYDYDDAERLVECDYCGEYIRKGDAVEEDCVVMCRDCYETYFKEEEEGDEVLHG